MAVVTDADRLALAARRAGCPSDQIINFLDRGYVPQPKQLEFHAAARLCDQPDGPDEIGFGGARGPGKSHGIFAQLAMDDCRRMPGLKALYLRKVGKQAKEQFEDLRRSVLRHVPHDYSRQAGVVTLWDDSRIFIGNFKDEKDIDNYLGIEYDAIAIEETTSLALVKYRTLRDSNRTSKPGWRPRIYNSTNPGNIGHQWYKQKFIAPARAGNEKYTRFIFATIDDNAFIDSDYERKLEENTGWRLRAYRYGDWDIAAGQFFSTWRHESHVIESFDLPYHWRIWCSLDYGFTHPTVVHLMAQDDDGHIYTIDEHRQSKWLTPQHADAIKSMLARHNRTLSDLSGFVAGHDVFHQGRGSGDTIADQYAAQGIQLERADIDRISGAGTMLGLLGDPNEGLQNRWSVMDRCRYLIDTIPAMQHDPNRPEDVLKVDVDEDGNNGDDPYDCARYGLMASTSGGSFSINYR